MTQLIGEMPQVGQKVRVLYFDIEVIEVSQMRIDVVKIIESQAENPGIQTDANSAN